MQFYNLLDEDTQIVRKKKINERKLENHYQRKQF